MRDRAEAEAHLAALRVCRERAEARASVRDAVRTRLREAMGAGAPAGRAPAGAPRARIEQQLARQRRPLWRRVFAPIPLATAAACAAGVLVVLATRGGPDVLLEEAVRKHNRDLPLEVTSAGVGGADAIPGWFAGKLDFRPSPPASARTASRSSARGSPTSASGRRPTSATSSRAATPASSSSTIPSSASTRPAARCASGPSRGPRRQLPRLQRRGLATGRDRLLARLGPGRGRPLRPRRDGPGRKVDRAPGAPRADSALGPFLTPARGQPVKFP